MSDKPLFVYVKNGSNCAMLVLVCRWFIWCCGSRIWSVRYVEDFSSWASVGGGGCAVVTDWKKKELFAAIDVPCSSNWTTSYIWLWMMQLWKSPHRTTKLNCLQRLESVCRACLWKIFSTINENWYRTNRTHSSLFLSYDIKGRNCTNFFIIEY